MRKLLPALLCVLAVMTACKKEKPFTEPDLIFKKWAKAIKELNYKEYSQCEAYPKSEGVFRELYRDSYFTDCMITETGKLDKDDIQKDHEGKPFIHRTVFFECTEVKRKPHKAVGILRGDVKFIRYTEGERRSEGWLMWNRNLVRISR